MIRHMHQLGAAVPRLWLGMIVLSVVFVCPARATYHFMQIEQIVGGVNGDVSAQAIQLRMRANGQDLLERARIRVWDANGENPILLIDFASNVANDRLGDRVLAVSSSLSKHTEPRVEPDFTLTSLIPASYLAAGSLTFENDAGTLIVVRLSWGGAAYTGRTHGALTNDTDGEFGPPVPGPLPSTNLQALLFQRSASDYMVGNSADFLLTEAPAVFFNNAGVGFALTPLHCPDDPDHDIDEDFICGEVDNCPSISNEDQSDTDADGFGDACDDCPDDPDKASPLVCGCGVSDQDLNGNALPDCLDEEEAPPGSDGGDAPDDADTPSDGESDAPPDNDPEDVLPSDDQPGAEDGSSGDDLGNPNDNSEEPDGPNDSTDVDADASDDDRPSAPPRGLCGLGMLPLLVPTFFALLSWKRPAPSRNRG